MNQKWISSKTVTDDEIEQLAADLLSNPSLTVTIPSLFEDNKVLYTREQMMCMFRLGLKMQKVKKTKDKEPMYARMRRMDIDYVIYSDINDWQAARTSASKLKKQFGCRFTVQKQKDEEDESKRIKITRLA